MMGQCVDQTERRVPQFNCIVVLPPVQFARPGQESSGARSSARLSKG
jgi:hypothetical protein